ncbi:MAG: hypothetical protein CMM01_26690 [Rhodopirellula sp.]|nr:hypothetical protein [Rhodopirellula sp.]
MIGVNCRASPEDTAKRWLFFWRAFIYFQLAWIESRIIMIRDFGEQTLELLAVEKIPQWK